MTSTFKYLFLVFFSALFAVNTSYAVPLSSDETVIIKKVNDTQASQLKLLEKIVNINSGTHNIAGVTKVGNIVRKEFDKLGFETSWVKQPASMQRAGTLIATRTGSTGKRLLLIGHIDTVFPPNGTFKKFHRNGNIATGPGIVDDKGGVVVMLYALKALHAIKALDDASITVVLTGDEENSGKPTSVSRKALIELAKQNDMALDFESGALDSASIARRGVEEWVLNIKGESTHSSSIFKANVGYGAVFELSRIINTIREELSKEQYFSFNPALVAGGSMIGSKKDQMTVSGASNIIAKTAVAKGDMRYISPEQFERAKSKIEKIISAPLSKTSANIEFQGGIPAMPPTNENKQLFEQYNQVSQDLGFGVLTVLDPGLRGAGDISHVAGFVHANLVGLGAVGTGMHSVGERADVSAFGKQTQKAAILMYRLTR